MILISQRTLRMSYSCKEDELQKDGKKLCKTMLWLIYIYRFFLL